MTNSNLDLPFKFKVFIFVLLIAAVGYFSLDLCSHAYNEVYGKKYDLETVQINRKKFREFLKSNESDRNAPRRKLVLFGTDWYQILGSKYPYLDLASTICPECSFTQDTSAFDFSDAVVFHGFTTPNNPPETYKRPSPKQVWVWMFEESAQKTHGKLENLQSYRNLFNWTMTFRRDSDVFSPYGRFVAINETPIPAFNETWAFLPSDVNHKSDIYKDSFLIIPSEEDLKNRKLIAWITSHCSTVSARELVAKKLAKYVPIDIYGACGALSCGSQASYNDKIGLTGNAGIDCRLKIEKNYKFYLAFENSLCEDYVTEKYFDTLLTQMVPIVYGSANYSEFAPPKSFINVADFATPKDLADYLLYLDKNPKEFLKYFEWRKDFWVQNNGYIISYCNLCKKLWEPNKVPKYYPDIKEWYLRRSDFEVSGKSSCTQPSIRAS